MARRDHRSVTQRDRHSAGANVVRCLPRACLAINFFNPLHAKKSLSSTSTPTPICKKTRELNN